MSVKGEIIKELKKVIEELAESDVSINLEISHDFFHGDYSTSAAIMTYSNAEFRAKNSEFKSPAEVAWEITRKLKKDSRLKDIVRHIEVAPAGFINFWLSNEYLLTQLKKAINKKDGFSKSKKLEGKKIVVEFGDPNPFKELHIGHLRNLVLGESFSRLLENQGAKVFRVNYQGDVGLHVAKSIYGIQNFSASLSSAEQLGFRIQNLNNKSKKAKAEFLGRCYVLGAKAYEEDEKAKKEIQSINIKIYKNDSSVKDLWQRGRQWSLEYFDEIYKRLGVKYKYYYFESNTAPLGREIVLEYIKDKIFEKHDGAVIFRGDKDMHTRVFLTGQDYATYEAKDLALSRLKYQDVPYDLSIIITANEQTSYFSVILAAMKKISPELADKTKHYPFGFVSLKEGKMSSRRGNIISAEWLLDEVRERFKKAFPDMDEDVLEKVAVGAVKYSMLKFSRISDISFSFEESISLEGNSGPYLQYTYARTQSILRKSKIPNFKLQINTKYELESEELSLLRLLCHFEEIAQEAYDKFAPNILCNYLFDLAQKFNLFYQKHTVLGEDETHEFRLSLTKAIGLILKNGLYLLGVEAVEKM